jgi:DNA-binding HxlR family transcriptional regulator
MKSYNQFCGTAYALDILGERWTLLILRDLLAGPRRYGDLMDAFPGITTNLLAKRLKDMSNAGLVERLGRIYQLTAAGRRTEPIILAMAEFGSHYLQFPPKTHEGVSARSMVLNLKRRYGGGWCGSLALDFEDVSFLVQSDGEKLTITDDFPNETPVTRLTNKSVGFALWIMQSVPLVDLIERSAIEAKGDSSFALSLDEALRR